VRGRGRCKVLRDDVPSLDVPSVIELLDVCKRYGPVTSSWAVRRVRLDVAEGELVVLVGESGSGKTTLLKLVNRLVEPSEGAVRVNGKDVRDQDAVTLRRGIGYVIQHIGLFPHLDVAENVAVVPRLLGWSAADIARRVDELLELVGLDPAVYRARAPAQLSGGQRQRVGVARALAARPRILLMDEPFGALDPITREALQGELRRIHKQLHLTTVLVTHDMAEALALADRVVVLRAGEVAQVGTPTQLLRAPADEHVQHLVGMVKRQAALVDELLERAP